MRARMRVVGGRRLSGRGRPHPPGPPLRSREGGARSACARAWRDLKVCACWLPALCLGEGGRGGEVSFRRISTLFAIFFALTAHAQPPAEGPQLARARGNAGKRLAEVSQQLADNKPQQAADALRKLLAEAGDDLISDDARHFRTVRTAAREVLAKLPEGEQRAWRERSDMPAAALLARASAANDIESLEAVAEEHPLSASAQPALELLGELAFTRGEFRAAEVYWSQIGGDAPRNSARRALAVLMQGDPVRSKKLTAEFRVAYPDAAGQFAGRSGNYAETLAQLMSVPPPVPPPIDGSAEWATFGGNAARTAHAARPLARYWPARPSWRLSLREPDADVLPDGLAPASQLVRHPVVIGETGFVADSQSVVAFDLTTGARRGGYRHPMAAGVGEDADSPLTAVPTRQLLFARLGPAVVAPPPAGGSAVLACFRVIGGELTLNYTLKPPVAEGVAAAWEAAPAWRDGRIYAAFIRESNNRLVTAMACYSDSGGEPIWVADLAEAGVGTRAELRTRPEPVTLGGGRVYYCTHGGFVVALHAATGRPAWAHAYPPATRPTPEYRAITPPIFEGGRLFCAPTDADRVIALDAVTGELIWEDEGTQTEQLIGIGGGHLLASVAAPSRGLRGYDLATGSTRGPRGWVIADDPQLRGFGCGFVAGGALVWPTRSGVFFVRPSDGLPLAPHLKGPHGNLAFAQGVLLAATPTEVMGYVRDSAIPTFEEALPRPRSQSVADLLASLAPGGGATRLEAFRRGLRLTPALDVAIVRDTTGVPARLGSLAARHFGAAPPMRPPREPPDEAIDPPSGLGPDIQIDSAVPLPSRGCVPLLPFVGRAGLTGLNPAGGWRPLLIVADSRTVHAIPPRQAEPLWSATLPDDLRVSHAVGEGDRVTCAGARGFVSLARDSGRIEWVYRQPTELPDLADWQLAWPFLTARVGAAQRICLDVVSGEIVWGRDSAGRARLGADAPATESYASPLTAVAGGWMAQVAPGQRAVVARETGEWQSVTATYPTPWPGAAAKLSADRVAVAEDPGTVRALECGGSVAARPLWEWRAGRQPSLTGRMPHLAVGRAGLFVAVERNHATELRLLMPRGGTPHWQQSAWLPAGVPNLAMLAEGGEHVFIAVGDGLHAVRLIDGQLVWSIAVPKILGVPPGSPFTVQFGVRGVVIAAACPGEDTPRLSDFAGALIPNRLVIMVALQLDAWARTGVRIAVLDAMTGARRGGLHVQGGVAAWQLAGNHAVVVTPGVAHWLR